MTMKFGKKLVGAFSIASLCLVVAATGAFAASYASKSTTGYGTLRGAISINESMGDFYLTTTVEKINDNAYLTGSVEWQNKAGVAYFRGEALGDGRGDIDLFDFWTMANFGGRPYQAYGSHGVQGGSTYGASAVYTFTTF